jgi:cell division protein FtsL
MATATRRATAYNRYRNYDNYGNISTAPRRRNDRGGVVTPMPTVERSQVERIHKRSPLKAVSVILIAGIFLASLFSVLYMNAKITEVDLKISKVDSEITKLSSENTELQLKIDGMMSMKNVEKYAITELGMQKISRNQISYIKLNDSDKIEIEKKDKSLVKKISDFLM